MEAQAFSRRRLTTAFVSGTPGGREVEPNRPLRAVVGGAALSVALLLGGLAAGYLAPSLPSGWSDNSLVIAKTSGARYVALKNVLYPVINTTSARLLIAASSFKVVTVDDDKIATTPRGATIGILGAPDSLTPAARLSNTGWLSCAATNGAVRTAVGMASSARSSSDRAAVVQTGDHLLVVTAGHRLPIRDGYGPAVLRALGLDSATPVKAPATWTNLFPAGPELRPLALSGVGRAVSGLPAGATVGSVLAVQAASAEPRRYLVTPQGQLAVLPPFANALYRLGAGSNVAKDIPVTTAQVGALQTVDQAIVPDQWPEQIPPPLSGTPCALLTAGANRLPVTALASAPTVMPPASGTLTTVAVGTGALVRSVGDNVINRGPVLAIDQTASAYTLADSGAESLQRLGYSSADVAPVPQAWLEMFRAGPVLSSAAAAATVSTGK